MYECSRISCIGRDTRIRKIVLQKKKEKKENFNNWNVFGRVIIERQKKGNRKKKKGKEYLKKIIPDDKFRN